ncbi:MAG: glycosyltransferase [Jatrophihabitans sp.]
MAEQGGGTRRATASIVVPAHNEAGGIARLLTGLLAGAGEQEFEVLVVCNGCTDQTATIAGSISPDVVVIEIEQPSKRAALARGDAQARYLPRIYLDADLEIGATDIRKLIQALAEPGVLAVGPSRLLPRTGLSWPVRAYYGIWEQLPGVRSGLFGRGVIALSGPGYERIRQLPPAMSDDLAISEAFSVDERRVLDSASVLIRPPRTLRDLMRRRIRVNTGNAQLDQHAPRSAEARTSPAELAAMVRRNPANLPGVLVFLAVAVASRLAARRRIRRGDYDTWLRDESSRRDG